MQQAYYNQQPVDATRIHCVYPGVYVSGLVPAQDFDLLRSLNIHGIINISQLPNRFSEQFTYLTLNLADTSETRIKECFEQTNAFIERFRDRGVLVHCAMGASRSPSFILAWMLKHLKRPLASGLDGIRRLRPFVAPNEGFLGQLREYENECINTTRNVSGSNTARVAPLPATIGGART